MHLRIVRAADVRPEPFVEPPEGRLDLVDLFARPEGAPFAAGICEIWAGRPVAFDYDHDAAVCYMIEGTITLTEAGESRVLTAGDVVYVPQVEGLVVEFGSEDHGRFFYVTYPHWR